MYLKNYVHSNFEYILHYFTLLRIFSWTKAYIIAVWPMAKYLARGVGLVCGGVGSKVERSMQPTLGCGTFLLS